MWNSLSPSDSLFHSLTLSLSLSENCATVTVTVAVDNRVKYIASTHQGRNIIMIEFSTFRARETRYYDASCSKQCDKFIKFTVILIHLLEEAIL